MAQRVVGLPWASDGHYGRRRTPWTWWTLGAVKWREATRRFRRTVAPRYTAGALKPSHSCRSSISAASAPAGRRGWYGLGAGLGFIAARFIFTPLRIKVLTLVTTQEIYGSLMVASSTMAVASLVASGGVFEFILRKLPGRAPAEQARIVRALVEFLLAVALAVAIIAWVVLRVWPPRKLDPSLLVWPSAWAGLMAASILYLGFVFVLFSTGSPGRARALQVLGTDLWFLPVAVVAAWGASESLRLEWAWLVWWTGVVGLGLVWTAPLGWLRAPAERAAVREAVAFGVPLLPMVVGDWLFRVADQYVLLAVQDVRTVALYALAVNIAMVGYFVGTTILDLKTVEFYRQRNQLAASGATGVVPLPLRRSFTAMVRWALVVGMAVAGLLLTSGRPLVRWLSRPDYVPAADLFPWVVAQPTLFMLNLIGARVLASQGRSQEVGLLTLMALVVCVVCNVRWAPTMGARGTALANLTGLTILLAAWMLRLDVRRWWSWAEFRLGRVATFAAVLCMTVVGASHVQALGPTGTLAATLAITATAALLTRSVTWSELSGQF